MKIKEIKCPNCNANISIPDNATKGVCEYCKGEFIIDDDTVEIKHTGTIEITDDTSLQVAETTLNKFKDYDKSLILYKKLLLKYAHKREIYIGLVRSITKDFSITTINRYELDEVNEYFKKYKILATEEEVLKYENQVNELNKNYWYNTLDEKTNNFNPNILGEKINIIEEYYNNYQSYCGKKDNLLKFKYEEYINEYKKYLNKRKRQRNTIIKVIIGIVVGIILLLTVFLLTENTKKKTNSINLSEINKHSYLIKNDYNYFSKYFKKTLSNLEIKNVKLNNESKTVDITVILKNIISKKEKTFNFIVNDDMGPIITPISCSFTDTEEVNLQECFSLYDFTDGEINKNEAVINDNEIDFKTNGTKKINVSVKDKDGNENSLDIDVIITKTPFELEFNLEDKLTVGKNYTPTIKITPNTIKDTSVKYTYDENLVTFENNNFRVLKKGNTEICAISNYNEEIKKCKNVNLELICKDTYNFSVNGSKEVTITAGESFCTGTYKIYATVTNKNNFYTIKVKPKDSHTWESLTIYKNSYLLNMFYQKVIQL